MEVYPYLDAIFCLVMPVGKGEGEETGGGRGEEDGVKRGERGTGRADGGTGRRERGRERGDEKMKKCVATC
jgi:hypothetical protein